MSLCTIHVLSCHPTMICGMHSRQSNTSGLGEVRGLAMNLNPRFKLSHSANYKLLRMPIPHLLQMPIVAPVIEVCMWWPNLCEEWRKVNQNNQPVIALCYSTSMCMLQPDLWKEKWRKMEQRKPVINPCSCTEDDKCSTTCFMIVTSELCGQIYSCKL